jgi:hypothetical protein
MHPSNSTQPLMVVSTIPVRYSRYDGAATRVSLSESRVASQKESPSGPHLSFA